MHGWGVEESNGLDLKQTSMRTSQQLGLATDRNGFLNADAVHRFTKNDQANFRYQFVPWIPVMAPLEYAFVLHAQPMLFAIFVISGRTARCYL